MDGAIAWVPRFDLRAGRRLAALLLPAFLLTALLGTPAAGGDSRLDVKIVPAYFTGTFGGDVETDILYVPLILQVGSTRQEFRATLPYLSLRTAEPVTFVGDQVLRRGAGGETTESGAGDAVLREDVYLLLGGRRTPWIWGGFRMKLPTADETQGLGTGEMDYGPGLGVSQPLGAGWSLLLTADRVIRGDTETTDFRNTTWLAAGVQARPTSGTALGLVYESRQSAILGREAIRDVSLSYGRRLGDTAAFQSTLFAGLSDTAEDYGVSLGFTIRDRR